MAVKIETVYRVIDEMAPFADAYAWDNSGWLLRVAEETQSILVALDLTDEAVDEAIAQGCGLIVTHHPQFFEAVKRLDMRNPEQARLIHLIQNNISLISAHTNMDKAAGGINDKLAELLGLTDVAILPEETEPFVKIVVFVPDSYTHRVMEAACQAGAGQMGNYSCCTFGAQGTGTFLPNEGAKPFVGTAGILHREEETRLEMLCPEKFSASVVQAVRKNHPYEVPAIDVYALQSPRQEKGVARLGRLGKPLGRAEFAALVKRALDAPAIRVSGGVKDKIETVAVCGGGGGSLLNAAQKSGADAFLTGELKHSDYIRCGGMLIAEAGHFDTEKCFVELLVRGLQQRLNALQYNNIYVLKAAMKRPYETV